jgi:hypothetical protein
MKQILKFKLKIMFIPNLKFEVPQRLIELLELEAQKKNIKAK